MILLGFNVLRVRLVRINKTKIMIDKKQLIEDLLECVNDATDTQTAMTGMTMCAMLINEVIDQALILPVVSNQRELLIDAFNWYRQTSLNVDGYPSEDLVDKFIQDN